MTAHAASLTPTLSRREREKNVPPMDADIALILLQDGVVNGAIYALLALSLVLVFAVTRVILIPQGEFVAYGALTYAALDDGRVPGSIWLLAALGAAAMLAGLGAAWRTLTPGVVARLAAECLLVPALVLLAVRLVPSKPGVLMEALLTLAIVTPMAPYLYRLAFQPLAEASVLVLLIASIGAHLALLGLGLVLFGPEGYRAAGFSDERYDLGPLTIPGQALWIVGVTLALMLALYLFFDRTLAGKALRATAVNRLGARLVGIATSLSGRIAFVLAGGIGALSGILIAPLTTVYYDSGFLVGLKGFVAAIIGGLASYPVAALAAIVVGCVESLSSFYASAFKEVIVFTVIIPVLLWRSFRAPAEEE
jgi:branched-chain amino acid transport system permease protein